MKAIDGIKDLASFSVFLFLIGNPAALKEQEILDEPPATVEQQLEDLTAANETEDDAICRKCSIF